MHVLPEWHSKGGQLVALFPSRRGLLPSVRAFVDFLKEELPALVSQPCTPVRSVAPTPLREHNPATQAVLAAKLPSRLTTHRP